MSGLWLEDAATRQSLLQNRSTPTIQRTPLSTGDEHVGEVGIDEGEGEVRRGRSNTFPLLQNHLINSFGTGVSCKRYSESRSNRKDGVREVSWPLKRSGGTKDNIVGYRAEGLTEDVARDMDRYLYLEYQGSTRNMSLPSIPSYELFFLRNCS